MGNLAGNSCEKSGEKSCEKSGEKSCEKILREILWKILPGKYCRKSCTNFLQEIPAGNLAGN